MRLDVTLHSTDFRKVEASSFFHFLGYLGGANPTRNLLVSLQTAVAGTLIKRQLEREAIGQQLSSLNLDALAVDPRYYGSSKT